MIEILSKPQRRGGEAEEGDSKKKEIKERSCFLLGGNRMAFWDSILECVCVCVCVCWGGGGGNGDKRNGSVMPCTSGDFSTLPEWV